MFSLLASLFIVLLVHFTSATPISNGTITNGTTTQSSLTSASLTTSLGNCSSCSTCTVAYTPYNALLLYSAQGWPLPQEYLALASYATATSWPGTKSIGPFPIQSNSTRPTTNSTKIRTSATVGSSLHSANATASPTLTTNAKSSSTTHFCSPTFKSIGTDAVSVWCTCNNGLEIPTLPATVQGDWPCPRSDIPRQATLDPGNVPLVTQSTSGTVYECFHTLKNTGVFLTSGFVSMTTTFTDCVGSTSVLSTRPTPTVRVEASTGSGVFVGQMGTASATALAYNVSSAIMEACTSTAANGAIGCPSSATIPGVPYPSNDNMDIGYGDLTFGFGGGTTFENHTMLSVMANATGSAAARSVLRTSDNCQTVSVQGVCGRIGCDGDPVPYDFPVCSAASGLIVEFYDGVATDGPTNAIWITFEFTGPSGLDVIDVLESACEAAFAAIDFLNAFILIFAEVPVVGQVLGAGGRAAEDIVEGTCAAIEGVAHGIEAGDGSE